jgi:class 3 adenylate cyclase
MDKQELPRGGIGDARRRMREIRDRDIGYLLGDPQRELPITIEEWVAAAHGARTVKYDTQSTGKFSLMDLCFELGCALVHDARPREARDLFQMIMVPEQRASPTKVLSLLGLGRGLNMWRRYTGADGSLSRAVHDAASLGDPILLVVARSLWTLNRSDAGMPVELAQLLELPVDPAATAAAPLIESIRAYAAARVYLRAGQRREGLALLDAVMAAPSFAALASVPRGLILRMSGVLCAVTGQSALARERLESAIGVFKQALYASGEVHAAFSLARLNAPVDRQQMAVYLGRAQEILEHTDDDLGPPRPGSRQMPGERAELLSRLAEHEFQRGNLQKALGYYQQDLKATRLIEGVPRALGYVERNVGRILLALRRPDKTEEAIAHFEASCALFVQVQDAINVFFTLYLLGHAYLEAGMCERAEDVVNRMAEILRTKRDRDKEQCIVEVLRAQVLWKHHLEIERALGVIVEARNGLRRYDTDYYYIHALIVEGTLLIHTRDLASARWQLLRARRYAVSRELEDLRRQADELLDSIPPDPRPRSDGVGRMKLAILYAGLRGFTTVCQVIDTAVMAEFIREFAEMIGQQASRFEGKPVRFLGDCVMAVFGGDDIPYAKERMALEAACSMCERFKNLRQRWGARHPDLAGIGFGFGLSTGPVVADRFGSEDLSEYSVIGEAVNQAARLQEWAADEEIILGEPAFQEIARELPDLPATARMVQLRGYKHADVPARVVHAPTVWPRIQRDRSRGIGLDR